MNPSPVEQANLADLEEYIARQIDSMAEPDRSDFANYLRAHPGHSRRDWKGKSVGRFLCGAALGEKPWSTLKPLAVRQQATRELARQLPLNIRRAAARDPKLVWNPLARKYRLRAPGDPPPAT